MSYFVFGSGSCGIGSSPSASAIGAGEDAEHARHRRPPRAVSIRDDARMRMRRAHHRRIGLTRQAEIVAEAALAGEQPRVFLAPHRLADGRLVVQ